jgi:formyltetrahydrofolate-dependent phosphoribosylglycinamide formyltransferase
LNSRSNPIRLGVLLSGGGTTMENFFEKIDEGFLNAVVSVVISSTRSAFGLVRAKRRLVPSHVVRREDHAGVEDFSDAITSILKGAKVDLVCMAGFLQLYLIPSIYEDRVMNIHPALIPKYCGKGFWGHHVHEAVVAAGETESGCTVHFADNEYDHGPIIVQRKVLLDPGETPDEVAAKVFKEECIAYPEAIRRFIEGEIGPGKRG